MPSPSGWALIARTFQPFYKTERKTSRTTLNLDSYEIYTEKKTCVLPLTLCGSTIKKNTSEFQRRYFSLVSLHLECISGRQFKPSVEYVSITVLEYRGESIIIRGLNVEAFRQIVSHAKH